MRLIVSVHCARDVASIYKQSPSNHICLRAYVRITMYLVSGMFMRLKDFLEVSVAFGYLWLADFSLIARKV